MEINMPFLKIFRRSFFLGYGLSVEFSLDRRRTFYCSVRLQRADFRYLGSWYFISQLIGSSPYNAFNFGVACRGKYARGFCFSDDFGNLIHRKLADGDLLVIVLRPEVRWQVILWQKECFENIKKMLEVESVWKLIF